MASLIWNEQLKLEEKKKKIIRDNLWVSLIRDIRNTSYWQVWAPAGVMNSAVLVVQVYDDKKEDD